MKYTIDTAPPLSARQDTPARQGQARPDRRLSVAPLTQCTVVAGQLLVPLDAKRDVAIPSPQMPSTMLVQTQAPERAAVHLLNPFSLRERIHPFTLPLPAQPAKLLVPPDCCRVRFSLCCLHLLHHPGRRREMDQSHRYSLLRAGRRERMEAVSTRFAGRHLPSPADAGSERRPTRTPPWCHTARLPRPPLLPLSVLT